MSFWGISALAGLRDRAAAERVRLEALRLEDELRLSFLERDVARGELEAARRRIVALREALADADARIAVLVAAEYERERDMSVAAVVPDGPVHPQCLNAAGRICAHCAPRLGVAAAAPIDRIRWVPAT